MKPSEWKDWQRPDWEETALASVGSSQWGRLWTATCRVVHLGLLASPLAVLTPLSYVSDWAHAAAWEYSLHAIEWAGPTWIKLMQWASTRQDLFSPEFCQHFSKLQDDTKGHSWEETQKILRDQLGERGLEALEIVHTGKGPIGSGCIAQVYQGRLLQPTPHHPVGTKVAVKVQHPGIWKKVCVDFYIFHKIAKFLEDLPRANLKYLSLVDTVRQFRDVMIPQLDLTIEAANLKRFNKDFANDDQIHFPRPLDELTTSQVLVETFCEGTPIIEYTKSGTPEERKLLAHLGLQMTLNMIFLHDFLHGDLHPGNILVAGTYPKLKMIVLDCGLVLEMGPEQHANVVRVLGAFTRRDGRTAGELMVDLKSESQASPEGRQLFIEGIQQICIMDQDQNFIESVGDYITDICSMACIHRVKLEGAL
jgi:aarF domain-containing kinase